MSQQTSEPDLWAVFAEEVDRAEKEPPLPVEDIFEREWLRKRLNAIEKVNRQLAIEAHEAQQQTRMCRRQLLELVKLVKESYARIGELEQRVRSCESMSDKVDGVNKRLDVASESFEGMKKDIRSLRSGVKV
jgi:tRNA(Ile)-lysidine synthase TilS/MesJ